MAQDRSGGKGEGGLSTSKKIHIIQLDQNCLAFKIQHSNLFQTYWLLIASDPLLVMSLMSTCGPCIYESSSPWSCAFSFTTRQLVNSPGSFATSGIRSVSDPLGASAASGLVPLGSGVPGGCG